MTLIDDFLQLIYPRSCLGCTEVLVRGESLVCTDCISKLPFADFETSPSMNPTARKFHGKIPITEIFCLLNYKKGNITQILIHQFKYKGKKELANLFSKLQAQRLIAAGILPKYDIIVPIPLHKSKLRTRGYNQSELYAQYLGQHFSLPIINNALVRIEKNMVQALLNRHSRYRNVQSIYSIGEINKIKGKSILLVDDVITTGATLDVCANLLLENGAKNIGLAAIATSVYS